MADDNYNSQTDVDTNDERITVFQKYPFMVPFEEYKKWEGVIYSQGKRYHLLIRAPCYPSLKGYSLFCSGLSLSNNFSSEYQCSFNPACLLSLLDDISSRLIYEAPSNNSSNDTFDLERLKSLEQIVTDVDTYIGRDNVDSVDEQTSWVRLKYSDSGRHDNYITVGLDKRYPDVNLRIVDVDLPDEVLSQFGQARRLGDMYNYFIDCVESLIPFWKMTSELADEAWIIEPLEPSRKDVHRRIYLSDNLSVQLTFNPLNVDSMPDIKFLGSLGAVSQARDTYQKKLQESGWWSDSNIVINLCRLLGLDNLPKKSTSDGNQYSGNGVNEETNDCSICYETSIEGETLPAKWCSNKNCSGRFHHFCLMEWLNSVATSKTSFDHISGPCPHCDEKIFCPIKLR